MKRCKTVDEYIDNADQWQDELRQLRRILQGTALEETVKWSAPCYTWKGQNVVGIGAFKAYVGLWFHQGAQLDDPDGVLINAQEGRTKAQRQWRFESKKEIKATRIKAYVKEAIAVHESGDVIRADRDKPVVVPPELQDAFRTHKAAKMAFDQLTKGRQREYADHIADAKRDATKQSRIEKILPMIEQGIGLHDKYRNC